MRRKLEEDRTRVSMYTSKRNKQNYWDVEPKRAAKVDKARSYTLEDCLDFLPENHVPLDKASRQRMLKAAFGTDAALSNGSSNGSEPDLIVWRTGPDKRYTYVNQTYLQLTGTTWEQTMEFGWKDVVHPDDLVGAFEAFSQAHDARAPFACELRIKRREGDYVWIREHASPRLGPHGEMLGFTGTAILIPGPNMTRLGARRKRPSYTRKRALVQSP